MIVGVAMLALSGACGGGDGGSNGAPDSTRSGDGGNAPGATEQDLTFTGVISGTMTSGGRGDTFFCGASAGFLSVGPILGEVGAKRYNIEMRIGDYAGPGQYGGTGELAPGSGVASVFVQVSPEGEDTFSVASPGAAVVIVNDDERSGTVDTNLSGDAGEMSMTGAWRCPPDF